MAESIHLKYLAVSQTDLAWGSAVSSVGRQYIAPGEPYPPANHPSRYLFFYEKGRVLQEYQLIYITSGEGTFKSSSLEKETTVKAGCMFLLFPGEWHTYRPSSETGWNEMWIGFQSTQMDSWLESGLFSKGSPIFNVGIHDDISSLYNAAIKTAKEQEAGFQQVLGGIVAHLLSLAYFYDKNSSYRSSGYRESISRAKILIDEQYKTITPEALAEALGMGYSNFRKMFKEYTGFSPARYINEVRFNKTKELLTNTDAPVKEIADRMGFENYDYFFYFFKTMSGMTPVEYRDMTQGNKV